MKTCGGRDGVTDLNMFYHRMECRADQMSINITLCLERSLHLEASSAFELQGRFRSVVVLEQIVIVLEGHNWGCFAINVGILLYSLNRSVWSIFILEKLPLS